MNHSSFIFFSVLLVVSATTTFGSAIKANNPNGEVKKESTLLALSDQINSFFCKSLFKVLNKR